MFLVCYINKQNDMITGSDDYNLKVSHHSAK